MGNVQIREPPRRRPTPIFAPQPRPVSKSPLRALLSQGSPQHKHLSPIRYRPVTQVTARHKATQRQLNKQSLEVERSHNKQKEAEKNERDNKEKCQDIIRRVRNFNDFLVELKKKLSTNCAIMEEAPQVESKRQFSMSVRLQNQKLELEKYKKLVERELSKTHSIENIAIQDTKGGEKILTIKYEEAQNDKMMHTPQKIIRNDETIRKSLTPPTHYPQTSSDIKQTIVFRYPEQTQPSPRQAIVPISVIDNSLQRQKEAKRLLSYIQNKRDEIAVHMTQQTTYHDQMAETADYLESKQRLTRIKQLHLTLTEANRRSDELGQRITHLMAQ